MDYEVKLEIFEGPLDLLLHLIYKNEVDIFDIPVATITEQYLEYIDIMKALNIDVAGEFLVMASTLIHIKSKMLLPDFIEDGEEEDPRLEITRPLIEYMRFKGMAEELSEREILDKDVFARPTPFYLKQQVEGEDPELQVNIFQLIDAFKRVLDNKLPGIQLKFRFEKWSVKEKAEIILARLRETGSIFFSELFEDDVTISEFIVTFLALLEVVHTGLAKVFQPTHESDIRLVALFDQSGR